VGVTRNRATLLNVGFWTLVAAFQASNWLLSPVSIRYPYPWRLVATAFASAYVWALVTPAIFRFAARLNPEHGARFRRIGIIVTVGLGVSVVMTLVAMAIHFLILPQPSSSRPMSGLAVLWSMSHWYPQQVATFFVVAAAAIVADTARRYREREQHAAQLQAQSADLQAQLAKARLAVLQTRLNPHFLFNTLNAVSALVATDPRGVRDMIALLSELLRHALAESAEVEIPLGDELRLVRLYLEILEIRYQGQLQTNVDVDPELEAAMVPNMILQPLVENAMKHGIDRAGGHGTIEVRAERDGASIVLSVHDTGPGDGAARTIAAGVGLDLTRARLKELYGRDHQLRLESQADGGMIARITLPFRVGAYSVPVMSARS
jgi:two-component system LytT family sensor kinase